jgi:5-methylcytosine-specific restriction endonuclease McrA
MKTWLLTWNPNRSTWENAVAARRVQRGQSVAGDWSCGVNKSILPDDRIFLIRLGKIDDRGIVGAGFATSKPWRGRPWSGKLSRSWSLYIDLKWDSLICRPGPQLPLPFAVLQQPPLDRVNWSTQSGGIQIAPDLAAKLERAWAKHYKSQTRSTPAPTSPPIVSDDSDDELSAFEGKVRRFFVKHRHRERLLRQRKILLAMTQGRLCCEVPRCRFDFERVYGPLGVGYAEVHHCHPLSSLKGTTKTKLDDLRIVCANCHRMIHHHGQCRELGSLIPAKSS